MDSSSNGSNLLALRALACLLVLVGHGTSVVFLPTSTDAIHRLSVTSPWMGVWVFFCLSGYLMGKVFHKGRYTLSTAPRFYWNRLVRIAPIYWIAVLSVAVVARPDVFAPDRIWGFLSMVLFVQSNERPYVVIGALWSVQTEVAFYVFVPLFYSLLAIAIRQGVRVRTLVICLLSLGVVYRACALLLGKWLGISLFNSAIMTPLVPNLDLFLSGMLVNWIVPSNAKTPSRLCASGALLFLTVISGLAFGARGDSKVVLLLLVLFGPTLTAVSTAILLLFLERSPTIWICRRVAWIGTLSYCLYVAHEPIYDYLRALAPQNIGVSQSIGWTLAAMAATVCVATAMYFVVERPTSRFKAFTGRKTEKIVSAPA